MKGAGESSGKGGAESVQVKQCMGCTIFSVDEVNAQGKKWGEDVGVCEFGLVQGSRGRSKGGFKSE